MGKIIFTGVAILLLNIVPLAGNPALLLHYKTIVLIVAAACLWLSQPAFSTTEAKNNKSSDRSSIIIILFMSSASVLFSVLEWAYFTNKTSETIFLNILGLSLLVSGVAIRIWAIQTLGKHFTATATINNDHRLIMDGPYQFVRHPSYLGAFMAIIGTPIFLNVSWAIAFVICAMSLAYFLRISVEEKMLSAYFGSSYNHYKTRTKRIIPFIW